MIILDMTDKRPLYEQICERFKELIVTGALTPNDKLPSVRQLAIDLSINPNTIQKSYSALEQSGYIYSVSGRGNFVCDVTALLPKRQEKFYDEMDALLKKAATYQLSPKDIIGHVEAFYDTKAD